jgi:murein DD-endopeptidase MepM/ murein hydrolase activator NlpD
VAGGQIVSAGQRIALLGSSGNSSGPHLHFEVRVDGRPVDPLPYIAAGRGGDA